LVLLCNQWRVFLRKCLSMLPEGRGRPMAKGGYRPIAAGQHRQKPAQAV
jgi:hypothetical protein